MPSEARRRGGWPVGRFALKDASLATAFACPSARSMPATLMAFCAAVADAGAARDPPGNPDGA